MGLLKCLSVRNGTHVTKEQCKALERLITLISCLLLPRLPALYLVKNLKMLLLAKDLKLRCSA